VPIALIFPEHFPVLAASAFLAGVVRGFSGFGLSAVLVACAAFFISPRDIIPTAQALEIIASVAVLKSVVADVDWHWLAPMFAGYVISIPLGVTALAYLPQVQLRVLGCAVLFVASLCLLFNLRPKLNDGLPLRFGTGLVAGFMAGATSLGGMIASVMLFAVALPPKNLRATLIVLFFFSACYSTLVGAWHGVVNATTLSRAAWLALPLLLGVALGSRGFTLVSAAQFKRGVLMILLALSFAGIISVVLR
jgi:uncharacterized protein